MKKVAVILAGGKGERFGGDIPKQFTKLAGRLVIEYTVDEFERHSDIDEIIVVCNSEWDATMFDLVEKNHWSKLSKIIQGGNDRFGSTHSALFCMDDYPNDTLVLFHDAVRPLIDEKIISDCLDMLHQFQAVDTTIPADDTIVEIKDNNVINNIPNRAFMRRGQTPQGFHLSCIKEAYAKALRINRRDFTCDCGVVRAMMPHIDVMSVDGALYNLKITNPIDSYLAEKYIQSRSVNPIYFSGNLNQLKDTVIVIFGGSSGIGKAISNAAKIHGAKVVSASRRENGVDVTNFNIVNNFLKETHEKYGKINYVINTSSILIKRPISQMQPQEMENILKTNLIGTFNVAMSSKQFLAHSKGSLLNFTSSSYTRGRAFYSAYSASKAGVVNMTQALAEEWGSENIRVNCINPERTATPMRTQNFGFEEPESLLPPETVAIKSLETILSSFSGIIVDVKK